MRVIQQIWETDANREITETDIRLRTGQFGGLKMNAANSKTYVKCRNYPDKELFHLICNISHYPEHYSTPIRWRFLCRKYCRAVYGSQ